MEQNTNDSVNCARVFITCKYCMRLFGVCYFGSYVYLVLIQRVSSFQPIHSSWVSSVFLDIFAFVLA